MQGSKLTTWTAALLCAVPACAWGAPAPYSIDPVALKSRAVLVVDADTGETLAAKNADRVVPIASLTKLMTALVVIESDLPLDEPLEITRADADTWKRTPSRLRFGSHVSRGDLLLLALMASENRAALALSRHYPGGRAAFVAQMNVTAARLGMTRTRFTDAAGLSASNRSTANDLSLLLEAAEAEPLIRDYSTRPAHVVRVGRQRLRYASSNRLVRARAWDIDVQKTGFTNEAGRCLVMQATVEGRRLAMIFLDSAGNLTRYGDAARVRQGVARAGRAPAHAVKVSLPGFASAP